MSIEVQPKGASQVDSKAEAVVLQAKTDAVVAQVKANVEEQLLLQLSKSLPAEVLEQIDVTQLVQVEAIVNTVLAGQRHVEGADPVDMIRMSDDGEKACRVQDPNGRTYWVITQRNGGTYENNEPTLPWRVIYDPEAQ